MELSPAPVAKKIADRSEGGSEESSIDIIENIEAITSGDLEDKDKDKKKRSDDSSDSSGITITEDRNNPPETEGGPVGAVEGSELPIGVNSKVGVLSDNSSSSDDSSSTGGSSKSSTSLDRRGRQTNKLLQY
jgi:hypothetical protein